MKSAGTSLALASMVGWLVVAASARPLGIWPTIGGAALMLGIAVLVLDGAGTRRTLRPSTRLVAVGATAGGLMAGATYVLYSRNTHRRHIASRRAVQCVDRWSRLVGVVPA